MSFFEDTKHKIEEAAGKVERTIGGAIGDRAMELDGEAHELHGEGAEADLEKARAERTETDARERADIEQRRSAEKGAGGEAAKPSTDQVMHRRDAESTGPADDGSAEGARGGRSGPRAT